MFYYCHSFGPYRLFFQNERPFCHLFVDSEVTIFELRENQPPNIADKCEFDFCIRKMIRDLRQNPRCVGTTTLWISAPCNMYSDFEISTTDRRCAVSKWIMAYRHESHEYHSSQGWSASSWGKATARLRFTPLLNYQITGYTSSPTSELSIGCKAIQPASFIQCDRLSMTVTYAHFLWLRCWF